MTPQLWIGREPTQDPNTVLPFFYLSEAQEKQASEMMEKLDQSNQFSAPIVTEITAFSNFYPAENYHQNYYTLNEGQPYCQYVVRPKVEKLQRLFEDKLKP